MLLRFFVVAPSSPLTSVFVTLFRPPLRTSSPASRTLAFLSRSFKLSTSFCRTASFTSSKEDEESCVPAHCNILTAFASISKVSFSFLTTILRTSLIRRYIYVYVYIYNKTNDVSSNCVHHQATKSSSAASLLSAFCTLARTYSLNFSPPCIPEMISVPNPLTNKDLATSFVNPLLWM